MKKQSKSTDKKKTLFVRRAILISIIILLLLVGYLLITGRTTGLIPQQPVVACKSPLVSDFSWQNKNAFYDQVSFLVAPQQKVEDWDDLEKAKKFVQLRVNNKYAASTYTDIRKVRSVDDGFLVTLDTKKLKSGAKQKIDITLINQLTRGRLCLTEREYIVASNGEIEEITARAEQDKALEKFPEIALANRIYYPSACKRKNFLDVPRGHKSSFQINKVVCEGLMFGNDETMSFRVDEPATRAELIRSALLLADILPSDGVRYAPYVDVDIESEFAPYIQKAKDMQILYSLNPGRKIQPYQYVTRIQALSILGNLLAANFDEVKDEDYFLNGFQDIFPEMEYGKYAIWAVKNGLLPDYDDLEPTERYFEPNEILLREDLAIWLVNAMDMISEKRTEISASEY